VFRKIAHAHFPPVPEDNPLFEYIKFIILKRLPHITLRGREFQTAEKVKDDFPWLFAQEAQFKHNVAEYVDQIIQPIRDHFQSTPELQEMLRKVSGYRVTRQVKVANEPNLTSFHTVRNPDHHRLDAQRSCSRPDAMSRANEIS
jgi:hypothetical protein